MVTSQCQTQQLPGTIPIPAPWTPRGSPPRTYQAISHIESIYLGTQRRPELLPFPWQTQSLMISSLSLKTSLWRPVDRPSPLWNTISSISTVGMSLLLTLVQAWISPITLQNLQTEVPPLLICLGTKSALPPGPLKRTPAQPPWRTWRMLQQRP